MPGKAVAGVGFTRPIAKTVLEAPERYALAALREPGEPCQQTLRTVIEAGLTALGWPQGKRIVEYAHYHAACLNDGHPNQFEGR
jgi:hypothetical protein